MMGYLRVVGSKMVGYLSVLGSKMVGYLCVGVKFEIHTVGVSGFYQF
jgi:hypothetical protein